MNIETIKQLKAMTSLGSSAVAGLKGICFTETPQSLVAKIFNGEVIAQLSLKPTGTLMDTSVSFKHLGSTLGCASSEINLSFSEEGNLILSGGLNATLNKVESFELENLSTGENGFELLLSIEKKEFLALMSKAILFSEKGSYFNGIKFYSLNNKLSICAGSSQNILICHTDKDFKTNFTIDFEHVSHVVNLLKNTPCDEVEIFKNETAVLFRFCDFLVKTPLLTFKQKMSLDFVANFQAQLKLSSTYKIYKSSLSTALQLALSFGSDLIKVSLEGGGLRISEETELGKFEHLIPLIKAEGEMRISSFKTPIAFINKILVLIPEQAEIGIYTTGNLEIPVLKIQDDIFLSLIKE